MTKMKQPWPILWQCMEAAVTYGGR